MTLMKTTTLEQHVFEPSGAEHRAALHDVECITLTQKSGGVGWTALGCPAAERQGLGSAGPRQVPTGSGWEAEL
eukprot:11989131-Heterocapsa_arctica.AAC.1